MLPPSLYADEVLCAAFRAARTPPYSIRVRRNSQNGETQCKCRTLFFNGTGPQTLSSGAGESLIFMFFYFLQEKMQKKCLRKLRKLSSRSNQSSTFAFFWGSKMSLQKLSEREHDFNIFPRRDFMFQKNPKSSKLHFFLCTVTDMHRNTKILELH